MFGLSALVVSQSIVVNTYATITMLAAGAYYFYLTKHWKLLALMLGMGLAIHLLAFFTFIIFLFDVRLALISIAVLPFAVFFAMLPSLNTQKLSVNQLMEGSI
jgi:hypothetical protein